MLLKENRQGGDCGWSWEEPVSRVVGTGLMCSGMKMHGWWTVEPPSAINSLQHFWLWGKTEKWGLGESEISEGFAESCGDSRLCLHADDLIPYVRKENMRERWDLQVRCRRARLFRWLGRDWDPEHKGGGVTFASSRDTSHNATGKETKPGSTDTGRMADRQAQGRSSLRSVLVFYRKYYRRSWERIEKEGDVDGLECGKWCDKLMMPSWKINIPGKRESFWVVPSTHLRLVITNFTVRPVGGIKVGLVCTFFF